ncbi:hypothetical protein [Acinetobacter sp. NIPH 2699]|uniref:hypothetical protein n=1 Tax=Acinetobacter sp. NIPH 2699 TaxID=2923433 RepID=UPI001F4A3125|nr:hypothetical protein [Acinetobacter sp. NIPH 2699]MCH7336224.1 hypothetical protein [Acinetobacter sp. NIPH 2699]
MRSWTLVCAALSASLVSVLSFVIPLCLYLNFQQSHLIHVVSNGMEVMIYLTPLLMFFTFICYLIVFAVVKLPTQIFDLSQLLKVSLIFFTCWMFLVIVILLEDQVNQIDFSTLMMSLLIYFALVPVLALGSMSANVCYFVMNTKKRSRMDISYE